MPAQGRSDLERLVERYAVGPGPFAPERADMRVIGERPGARSALSFWLSNEPSSVTRARQYAKVAAREWGMDGGIPAALLVVSELVGNAVRHTSSVIHVRLEHHGSRMRITVDDCEPGLVLRKDPDAMDDDGRGLVIVEAFALAWGVEQDADGKHVWADVAFP